MMAKQPPDNLGKRQHDLNIRVIDAFAQNDNFEDVKSQTENSDIDKFFKIDLAAKCRNLDYIIEVLKAGETLYAYRALKKCPWIYDDEYSHIIKPEYLQDNIFPVTSTRVKLLVLKTVAMKVRRGDRAEAFYHYCVKIKMTDIALKCLLFTSEEFKLAFMKNHSEDILRKKFSYIRYLIGKSFVLLEEYIKMLTTNHNRHIRKFRYFYPVDNIKYLDLLEKYMKVDDHYNNDILTITFDNKLCDDIMKKYKHRVFAKPLFYLNNFNIDIMARNITVDEAKILAVVILPSTAGDFWSTWYYQYRGKLFIDLLPPSEIYAFIKKIFNDKYPYEEFETCKSFYKQRYSQFMTVEQREQWALNQIKSDKQILGVGRDYLWYRFVNFKEAFEEVKKYLIVTKEPEKRADMLVTLIKEKRSSTELKKLFKYYNKRHANEPELLKIYLADQIIYYQNVFEFEDDCWDEFYSILLSMELYNNPSTNPSVTYSLENYKSIALYYHIVYEKEMSEQLVTFLLRDFFPHCEYGHNTTKVHFDKLNDQKRQFLFEYLHTFYTDKINEHKNKPFIRRGYLKRYLDIIIQLINLFNVRERPYNPEPTPQKQRKTRTINTNMSDRQLLRELKQDKCLASEKVVELKTRFKKNNPIEMRNFLNKIKIYFKDDLSESYLSMFQEVISDELENESVVMCVNAIFILGKESVKVNLMEKYAPENSKIDFHNLDSKKLCIQRAICRYAASSLPPVPLVNVLAYMQGDYVRYCLHLFSVYVAALPMSVCTRLVESLLEAPVSIQKHALRLAFQCLNVDSLKSISHDIWEKTKNVSLRSVIYKALFNRISEKNECQLRDILISFTLDLHDDDEKILFKLVESNTLPNDFLGEYKKATWKAISDFRNREPNIARKSGVIYGIECNLNHMDEEFVREIIEEHLDNMFDKNNLVITYSEEDVAYLYKEQWSLAVEYIVVYSCKEDCKKYVELAQYITKRCLETWNELRSGKYVYQRHCWEFIENLNIASMRHDKKSECLIPIYKGILDVLQEALPPYEIYMPKWEIELVLRSRGIIKKYRENFGIDDKYEVVRESLVNFGEEVGKLILEYVDTNTYYTSASEKLKASILKRVDEILQVIFSDSDEESTNYHNAAITYVGVGLVQIEILETYLFALEVLPLDVTDCGERSRNEYMFVLDKIKKSPKPELRYAAHQKLLKSQE